MKKSICTALTVLCASSAAVAEEEKIRPDPKPSPDVQQITPQLYGYTTELLFGEVWKRSQLLPRDRSLITLAALISAGQTAQMTGHLKLGLDNGLKPSEISALITHLAFYAGWPNAMSAVTVTRQIFTERGIPAEQLVPPSEPLLTLVGWPKAMSAVPVLKEVFAARAAKS